MEEEREGGREKVLPFLKVCNIKGYSDHEKNT